MKTLYPAALTLVCCSVFSPGHAASVSLQKSGSDSFAAAVLDCHVRYAHRYAVASMATASELAEGAAASCKTQMDAYVAHEQELAAQAGKGPFADDAGEAKQRALARYAHDYTVDAVIRARANPALLKP